MNFTPGDFKYSNLGSEVTNPFPCPLLPTSTSGSGVFENYAGIFPAKGTHSEYSRILIVTDSQQVRIGLAVFALKMFF